MSDAPVDGGRVAAMTGLDHEIAAARIRGVRLEAEAACEALERLLFLYGRLEEISRDGGALARKRRR